MRAEVAGRDSPVGFFARRWRGAVPLRTLFWRDMLAVGTCINLFATFAALMAAAMGVAMGLAVALHFAPLPYNVFLVLALWRLPGRPTAAVAVAALWLGGDDGGLKARRARSWEAVQALTLR